MSEATELITLPHSETALQVYTAPQGLHPYLQQIRAHLDTFEDSVPA